MRTPCCHSFLAFIIKFLNFFQAFIGLSIIIYSVYMLNQWNHHSPAAPPPSAPSPEPEFYSPRWFFDPLRVYDPATPSVFAAASLQHALPAPWFIYAFMGVGIVMCCITCIGHIAAEAINGCCLCFYTILTTILILVEAALVTFIAVDRHWERDLPFDPTGELDSLRSFIKANIDVFKWVGIAVVIMQALSLLFAMVLRALVSTHQRVDHDVEEDYDDSDRIREPLLNSHSGQTSGLVKGDGKGALSDIWSSRMREKYGLNGGDAKHNILNQT